MVGECTVALQYLDSVIFDPNMRDAARRVTNDAAYVFKENVGERCRFIEWTEP